MITINGLILFRSIWGEAVEGRGNAGKLNFKGCWLDSIQVVLCLSSFFSSKTLTLKIQIL